MGHALITWVLAHGRPPDNLVVLAVEDEAELCALWERLGGFEAESDGRLVAFLEPDLENQFTALAVAPEHWRALSSLPLLR